MAAEIPDGAVLVARAILNSSLWTMRPEDRILAITCLCQANWKPAKWFDGCSEILIRRGEFVTSMDKLVTAGGLTQQTVRTSLRNLENCGFLTRRSTRRYTVIFIPKYAHYQDLTKYYSKPTNGDLTQTPTLSQHSPNKQTPKIQHSPNNKQEGEEKRRREEGRAAALATPAPAAPPPPPPTPSRAESVATLLSRVTELTPAAARWTLKHGVGWVESYQEVADALQKKADQA
jgi:hypothetical protein